MSTLLPGTEVVARGLRWEVVTVDVLGAQTLYQLRCIDGALRGEEMALLHPFETITPVTHELHPERAAPLQNWLVYHQAFLLEQALGPDALLAVQPGRLRLEAYQLVPVLRAIRMSRVRLLLADGVGLGKTIQAGLVITELFARRIAHRLLIVTPAGPLLEQWRIEMAERFGLRLDVIDRARLEQIRRETEHGSIPFDHIPLGLTSIDFVKQERVLQQLERASYDIVVIDEAHHCMDLGVAQEREDSQRRRLAETLARRCDALLLLTATPHDGNDRSFASLCELLDPSLVDGQGRLRGERYRPHVVRRLKHHISDPLTGAPRFRRRLVEPCPVETNTTSYPAFAALQQALLDLVAPELRRAFRSRSYQNVLAYIALLKRSVSTVAACKATLDTVASRFQRILTEGAESQDSRRQRLRSLREYQRKLERFGVMSVEEEQEQRLLEAEELAQQLADLQRTVRSGSRNQARMADIVEQLEQLIELAEAAIHSDPKLATLIAQIQAIRAAEASANVLIYTEYTDSQQAVATALRQAQVGPVLLMSGEDNDEARRRITDRFRSESNLVLVSTDAAAEGLNLHQRCHHLIHLELPFNPNRLEQRNGRIDRFGQQYDPTVRYLYLRGSFEEHILLRLIAKYERQRERLTFVPNTLGDVAGAGAAVAEVPLLALEFMRPPESENEQNFQIPLDESLSTETWQLTADTTDKTASRELLEEIDRSLRGFEQAARTSNWLGEMGLNADPALAAEADHARARGSAESAVSLAAFVQDAVHLDGGRVELPEPEVYEIRLPFDWAHNLDDLPGYDADARLLRLSTDSERLHDAQGRPLSYLGRAHPLVRRALDRVRRLSFGSAGGQDIRVSAMRGPVARPELLVTFLGRVGSAAGREFERVLAVTLAENQPAGLLESAGDWLPPDYQRRAMRTSGVYEQHFQSWFADALADAQQAAYTGFAPVAERFLQEHRRSIEAELARQDDWLRQRAQELSGAPARGPQAVQQTLFDQAPPRPVAAAPAPANLEPAEQLAALHRDAGQPPRLRNTAESLLRLYHERVTSLQSRLALREPEIVLLGVLMIVPDGSTSLAAAPEEER